MSGEGLVLRAARGDQAVRSCPVDDSPVSIGSWPGATLPLDDTSLAPVHVILDPDGPGRWRLISLVKDGCRVNGRAVRRAFVTSGDRIAVGSFEISFSGSRTAHAPQPSYRPVAVFDGVEKPLRAVLRWQGTPIDARVLAPGELLSVGRGRSVTFELPEGDGRSWAAAACLDGIWHVALDAPTRAVNAQDDRPLLSSEPRTDGPKLPRGFMAGKLWAPLHDGARVRLVSGALAIELERCEDFQLARVERVPRWATREGQFAIITLLTVICLFAMIWITPRDLFKEILDTEARRALMLEYQRPPPSAEVKQRIARLTRKKDQDAEAAAKAQNEEGKAGRPDSQEQNARRAGPRSDQEVVKNQALLKALSDGATEQLLAGGSLSAANSLGHLDGPAEGDANGTLGLGLKGQGSGGGGLSADTVGVGPLGTKGVGMGTAAGAGKVGRAGQSDLGLDEPASVQGGLDREVIRRVIISHRAQVRYCYEKQLSSTPDLAGKVLIEFVITGEGSVSTARVSEQTLSDPAVGQCIVSKVKSWTFPKPKGNGMVVVTYPFLFKPSGQQGAH